MKVIFIGLLMTISFNIWGQSLSNIHISSGVLYSNVISKRPVYEGVNPFRYGVWASLGSGLQLKKSKHFDFNLELELTYQERMPLESFIFEKPSQLGIPSYLHFREYPSNPQNKLYQNLNFSRFPNFNYIHLGCAPTLIFGNKLKTSIGIGLFGGFLINKNETTIEHADFAPAFENILKVRGVTHNIEYTRFDFGWQPKISCVYQVNKKISLGVDIKSYYSLVRMNDTIVDEERVFNFFWVAYAGGISVQYQLNTTKENK